jgi:hypothetical protein
MLKKLYSIFIFFTFLVVSCGSRPDLKPGFPLTLASFTENGVTVNIALRQDTNRQFFLAATFIPGQAGFHLYSKNLPVDGEGRPTLLEVPAGSNLKVAGDLTESADAEVSSMEPGTLLVYPAGTVTLSLPVTLPDGKGWAQERVSVTYEACSDMTCLTPVLGKFVPIRVPEASLVGG